MDRNPVGVLGNHLNKPPGACVNTVSPCSSNEDPSEPLTPLLDSLLASTSHAESRIDLALSRDSSDNNDSGPIFHTLDEDVSSVSERWNSPWLHGSTLAALGLTFVSLLITVASLYHVSKLNDGLGRQKESMVLVWKYAPTTLLVLVAALWHQLDYNCRVLAPWNGFLRETEHRQRYLDTDYVSPISVLVLYRAIKNRHWAVAGSASGTLALAMSIGFSTGLLVLTSVGVTDFQALIPVNTTFSSLNFNTSFLETSVTTFYGITSQSLPYPPGTKEGVAFQMVATDDARLQNSSLSVSVDAFLPSFNCEGADGITSNITSPYPGEFALQSTLTSKNCRTTQYIAQIPDPYNILFPPRLVYANAFRMNCDSGSLWYERDPIDGLGSTWLFTVADIRLEQTTNPILNSTTLLDAGRNLNVTSWSATAANISAIFCSPSYMMGQAKLLIDTTLPDEESQVRVSSIQFNTSRSLAGLANQQLSSSLQVALGLTGLGYVDIAPLAGAAQEATSMFLYLMCFANGKSSLQPLLDTLKLKDLADNVFAGIATQMARLGLSVEESTNVPGRLTYSQDRLQVRTLSAIVLGISFALLILFTGLLYFTRISNLPFRDLDSVASYAAVLSGASAFFKDIQPATQRGKFWRPFTGSKIFNIFACLFAASLIIALQVLDHLSDSPQGISHVQISEQWAHDLSSILPAAIMMLVLALFQSGYFALSTFVPFARMHARASPANMSIMRNPTGKLPLTNLVYGVWQRHANLALASIAIIIGSFLTVVVSALYELQPFDMLSPGTTAASDFFNLTWHGAISGFYPDNSAGAVLGLIEHQNASYPPFTYNELVYPRFTIPDHLKQQLVSGDRAVLSIPATRASLNCVFAPGNATNISYSLAYDYNLQLPNELSATYAADITRPPGCVGNVSLTVDGSIAFPGTEEGYGSALLDLISPSSSDTSCPTIGFFFGYFRNGSSDDNTTLMTCTQSIETVDTLTSFLLPSMVIDPDEPPIVNESSRSVVIADAPFEIAQFLQHNIPKFNSTVGPVKSSVAVVTLETSSLDAFYQTVLLGPEGVPAEELMGSANHERFFSATQHLYRKYMAQLIHSNMRQNYSISLSASSTPIVTWALTEASNLAGNGAATGVTVLGKRNAVTTQVVASSKSAANSAPTITRAATQMQVSVPTAPIFNVTLQDSNALRLVQDRASKIALQVMLAAMILLSATACLMTSTQNVLLQNPCTLAGVISLLVGSRLCEGGLIPPGAEKMSDKELQKLLEGYVFRLGWWNVDTGQPMDPEGLNEKISYRYGIDVMRKSNWGRV